MNERYLLDTNALSEPIQRHPSAAFLSRFQAHAGEMATAAPAFSEMYYGCLLLVGTWSNMARPGSCKIGVRRRGAAPADAGPARSDLSERLRRPEHLRELLDAGGDALGERAVLPDLE